MLEKNKVSVSTAPVSNPHGVPKELSDELSNEQFSWSTREIVGYFIRFYF